MHFFNGTVVFFGEIWAVVAMLIFVSVIAFMIVGSERMAVLCLLIFILEAGAGLYASLHL